MPVAEMSWIVSIIPLAHGGGRGGGGPWPLGWSIAMAGFFGLLAVWFLVKAIWPKRFGSIRWGRSGRGGTMSLGGQAALVAYLSGFSVFALGMSLAHDFFKDKFIVLWGSFFLIPLIDAAWSAAFGPPINHGRSTLPLPACELASGGIHASAFQCGPAHGGQT